MARSSSCDREPPAAIPEANDDAIDVALLDEPLDVPRRPDDGRIDDALADALRVVVDESDHAIGEVVLIQDLTRDLPRALAGADEQDAFLELQRAGELVEQQAPRQNGQEEHEERRHEDAVANHEGGRREIEAGQHDRRGPHRLQQADDELTVRVDERQVVEVVVVQAQLTHDGDERDLPEARPEVGRLLEARGERHGAEYEQKLAPEHRQATCRHVAVE